MRSIYIIMKLMRKRSVACNYCDLDMVANIVIDIINL